MWQVDHELLATGKNVLNPKKFSKKPQMHTHTHKPNHKKTNKKPKPLLISLEGIHTRKERPMHRSFCIRSPDAVYNT